MIKVDTRSVFPMTRRDSRKQRRLFLNKRVNQQYSYTTREAIALFRDIRGNFDWLASKEGLAIEQWWVDRISQQRSAQTLTKAIPMGCFGVHDNTDTKLDDKIREFICNTPLHQEVDFEDDGAGTEWILTDVRDIYEELDFYPTCVDDILGNDEFMKLWFDRIRASKYSYFDDDDTISKVYKLKPWQQNVVDEMLGSDKTYHVLGLAPRFGKTLAVLDYFKRKVLNGTYNRDELWLVPASKSLSSNASFVNDYTDFGFSNYFNIVKDISLFVDDDKIIESLQLILPSNAKVVLVTDEGDLASHTEISVTKIKLIKEMFKVVEQIVMTGTGIGKATKIFKGIPLDEVNYQYITYTEMAEIGGDVVKRNFINVQYDITNDFNEEVLNIRQSADDAVNHPQLAKYIGDFTVNEGMERRLGLQPTEIVMVFIKPTKNKYLTQLIDTYQTMYVDKVNCMDLTGSTGVTNGTAEKEVKKKYSTMRKNGDYRKLIVFSAGIGSRSFSVSKIYREINLSDSELTPSSIQEFARPLTWEDGKNIADIIRIGFSPMELTQQLYLVENDIPDYSNASNERVRVFLMNNSFSNIKISENGSFSETVLGNQTEDVGSFLDSVCKFTDNTSYITTRIFTEGLVIDTDPENGNSKKKTKVVSTTPKKGKKLNVKKTKKGKLKLTSDDEKRLRQYVNITRCIPSIAGINYIHNINEFLDSNHWNDYLNIDKKMFVDNYNNSGEFKGIVDGLFRQNLNNTQEENNKRLIEYMKFIS